MADIDALLNRWQKAGVLAADIAERIRAYEQKEDKPGGLRWQGLIALIMGAILLSCGVALPDEIVPVQRAADGSAQRGVVVAVVEAHGHCARRITL